MARPVRMVLAAVAAGLVAVACGGHLESTSPAELVIAESTFPAEPAIAATSTVAPTAPAPASSQAPSGLEGLAAFDESLPVAGVAVDYFLYRSLESLSYDSDIVFIGRITGYMEDVLAGPPSEGDLQLESTPPDVYDGIVLTVDEVLKADRLDAGDEVTILRWSLLWTHYPDGGSWSRITVPPINIIRSGIEQRYLPDGPRYLVYALSGDEDGPYYDPDRYWFNTCSGVAGIYNGEVLAAAGPPMRGARLTLDDARAAIRNAQDIDPPTVEDRSFGGCAGTR